MLTVVYQPPEGESEPQVCSKTIIFHYKAPLIDKSSYTVRAMYVTSSDEPQRAYDGYEWEKDRKKNDPRWANIPSIQQDLDRSPVDLAMDKLGLATLLLQTAFHELLSRHDLEHIAPELCLPSAISFVTPMDEAYPNRGGGKLQLEGNRI